MKQALVLAAVLVLVLAPVAVAIKKPAGADEDKSKLQAKIDQLVKDLSDEDYEAREEATKALMEIGLPALKAVKEASAKADIDPEITYRAEKILKAIRLGIGADWPPEMALLCRHFDTLTPGEQSAALRRIISWGKQRTIPFLLTVLEKHQSDSTGREAMSSLFQFINDGEDFAENVLDVLEKPETPQQARLASHALRKLGRFSEAIDLIAKQDEIPRDEIARAVIEISRDLLGRDDYKEVEKLLKQHNKLLPDNDTRVAYLQAEALDHLNRSDDAQQLRLQALAMDLTENQRFLTADMLEQIGRPHLAGLEWQKTLDMAALGPIYKINAYLRLGSLSALLGWPHKGADYLEKGLEAFRKAKDDGFGITGASEEDIEDHIAELREKPKKEPSDGVEIKVVFKKDGYANYQEDLRDADFRVRLSVKPHGLRLLDQAKIEVVYDPEKSKLHVKLDSSDAATPIDVEKFDEPIIFILAQLDCEYVYLLEPDETKAKLLERYEKDYVIHVSPTKKLAGAKDFQVAINGKGPYDATTAERGIPFDFLPQTMKFVLTGKSQGGKETSETLAIGAEQISKRQ